MNKVGWSSILVAAMLLAVAVVAEAQQQPKKIAQIGFLHPGLSAGANPQLEGLRQRLFELGYVEGKNIFIEYRFAEGKLDRLSDSRLSWSVLRLTS